METFNWIYKDKEIIDGDTEGYSSFVYIITNLVSGRQYIGKKILQSLRKKIIKGKSKRVLTESDWKKYYGSCLELQNDVKKHGKENFKREILRFCTTKSEASYFELFYQLENHVLLKPKSFYNGYIGAKIHGSNLKNVYLE